MKSVPMLVVGSFDFYVDVISVIVLERLWSNLSSLSFHLWNSLRGGHTQASWFGSICNLFSYIYFPFWVQFFVKFWLILLKEKTKMWGKKSAMFCWEFCFVFNFHLIFCTFFLCFVYIRLLFRSTLGYLVAVFLWLNHSSNYACHTITNLYCLSCFCCWLCFFPCYLRTILLLALLFSDLCWSAEYDLTFA